ncbi:hypothetical protein PM082_013515 [Marasmius tenuissimus]|nr:hypothetical protein PM082_013515 [Marasmius tenuissimus]
MKRALVHSPLNRRRRVMRHTWQWHHSARASFNLAPNGNVDQTQLFSSFTRLSSQSTLLRALKLRNLMYSLGPWERLDMDVHRLSGTRRVFPLHMLGYDARNLVKLSAWQKPLLDSLSAF